MKRKLRVSLLVAGLIVLLLAAVAFAAAARWGVLDFFKLYDQPIQPMESAKDMISSDLGSDENARLRVTVREAVYDGANVRAVVEIAPAEGSDLFLVDPWSDPDEPIGTTLENKAASQGKTAYYVDYPVLRSTSGEALISSDPHKADATGPLGSMYALEGDSIVFFLSDAVGGASSDVVGLEVRLRQPDDDLAVPFQLKKSGGASTLKLIPEQTAIPEAGLSLISATLQLTPLTGYADILYQQTEIRPETLTDESMVYIIEHGRYFHRKEDCSGMSNAKLVTVREAKSAGRIQCPNCLIAEPRKADLYFELMDRDGNLIGLEDSWKRTVSLENGEEAVRSAGIFQPSKEQQSVYFLRPVDALTCERYAAIRCTVETSQ